MEVIIAALIAGASAAAKDTVGNAIKDSYSGLKALLQKRFAEKGKADDSDILEKIEKKPDSEGVKVLLTEELAEIEADKDGEIIQLAQAILKQEDPEGTKAGKYNIKVKNQIQGDFKGMQVQSMEGGEINQTIS
jgi:hypothetical protein